MKITVLGAGPAGLFAAILLKSHRADLQIEVIEQNPADATFGFGVVFSDKALDFLSADDPETVAAITPHMVRWKNIDVALGDASTTIDGIGFSGIGRLELLQLLQQRVASLGITPRFNCRIEDLSDLADTDLIIGADGLNSLVRSSDPTAFGEDLSYQRNRFVWYGADREFPALTQSFVHSDHGAMTAHHYSYQAGSSTFIIEMSEATFERTGFADMDEPAYRAECERIFAAQLEGASLIPNRSVWRQFPNLSCAKFYAGKSVLVGDALHTAHFSIGSGTRLALEDVAALCRALAEADYDLATALPAYQAKRAPVLDKLVTAAKASADWYEDFERHMDTDVLRFARNYIQRAGRIDGARMQALAPEFAARLDQAGLGMELA